MHKPVELGTVVYYHGDFSKYHGYKTVTSRDSHDDTSDSVDNFYYSLAEISNPDRIISEVARQKFSPVPSKNELEEVPLGSTVNSFCNITHIKTRQGWVYVDFNCNGGDDDAIGFVSPSPIQQNYLDSVWRNQNASL